MSERKYTVSEIERMRQALRSLLIPNGTPFYMEEKNREIEGQLQTYMRNGTDPEELEQRAAERISWLQEIARAGSKP